MSYFICKRAFRDVKGPIPTGSITDPVEIKRFRFRLQEGHIVEVTEQNFEKYASFFKQRFGIDIPGLGDVPSEEVKEPSTAKPVVKTTTKKAKVTE